MDTPVCFKIPSVVSLLCKFACSKVDYVCTIPTLQCLQYEALHHGEICLGPLSGLSLIFELVGIYKK